jgi:hypothetical protein
MVGEFDGAGETRITERGSRNHGKGQHPGPHVEVVIDLVIEGRSGPDLGRRVVDG